MNDMNKIATIMTLIAELATKNGASIKIAVGVPTSDALVKDETTDDSDDDEDKEEEDHSKFCKKCEQCDCEDKEKLAEYWWIEISGKKWTLCEDCGIAEEQDKCDTCAEELKNEEEEEEAIQPHCYKCFNMNMSITVNCFTCDKLYCKSHSYCILGYDDMPYCSKECFINA
jgi:hypothetical protein